MRMSDLVAQYILEMLEQQDGSAEIQRNELAGSLGCVPSQIMPEDQRRLRPRMRTQPDQLCNNLAVHSGAGLYS